MSIITPEVERQIQHSVNSIGQTVKALIDAGIEPPAIATALSSQFVNFIAMTAAFQGIARDEMMPKMLDSFQQMEEFALKQYDKVIAEVSTLAQKAANDVE